MKRVLLLLALMVCASVCVQAQKISLKQVQKYVKDNYGKDFEMIAEQLAADHPLTVDGMRFSEVLGVAGYKADALFPMLRVSAAAGLAEILYEDEENGVLITQRLIENIAEYNSATTTYTINLAPIIQYELNDGFLTITFYFDSYPVSIKKGGKAKKWSKIAGAAGAIGAHAVGVAAGAGAIRSLGTLKAAGRTLGGAYALENVADIAGILVDLGADSVEEWSIEDCYPFDEDDEHKKIGAEAFVMACTAAKLFLEKSQQRFEGDMIDFVDNGNLTDKQKDEVRAKIKKQEAEFRQNYGVNYPSEVTDAAAAEEYDEADDVIDFDEEDDDEE